MAGVSSLTAINIVLVHGAFVDGSGLRGADEVSIAPRTDGWKGRQAVMEQAGTACPK